MELTAPDDSVPIGTHVNLTFAASEGEPEIELAFKAEYGPPACRTVIESSTTPNVTGKSFEIIRAGAHDLELTATDGATPPTTDSATLTITGLPPDAVETDCAGAIATNVGGDTYFETIFIKVTAQGEPMGSLYTAVIAQVQEQVDARVRRADGTWPILWEPIVPPWAPPRQPQYRSYGTFYYRADESEVLDTKWVTVSADVRDYLAFQPPGTPFYQQRQSIRLRYVEGCAATDYESDDFYVTAVKTGNPDIPGIGGSVDFVDGQHNVLAY